MKNKLITSDYRILKRQKLYFNYHKMYMKNINIKYTWIKKV